VRKDGEAGDEAGPFASCSSRRPRCRLGRGRVRSARRLRAS
jgi:hypothetical protein